MAYTVLVLAFSVVGSFRWNAVLSAVARLFTYGMVCAALLVLRRKTQGADAFRLPAGWLFAGLGIAFCCVLLSRMGLPELVVILATAALASASWFWARRRAG